MLQFKVPVEGMVVETLKGKAWYSPTRDIAYMYTDLVGRTLSILESDKSTASWASCFTLCLKVVL